MAPARSRLPREQRRAQLIGAAARAFREGGFDGTSMEAVAEEAGVTRLIVYRNFSSKDELYRAVLTSVTDRLVADIGDPGALRESGPMGAGPAIVPQLLGVARAHPDAFRLLWRHALHEPAFAEDARRFRTVVAEVAEALIDPYLPDAQVRRWAAATLVAHVHDAICEWLDRGDPARDDELAARLTAGVRALVRAWATT